MIDGEVSNNMSELTKLVNSMSRLKPDSLSLGMISLYFEGLHLVADSLIQSYKFDKFKFEFLQSHQWNYKDVFNSSADVEFENFEKEEYCFADISQLQYQGLPLSEWKALYYNKRQTRA